jgi:hypothetical protein
VEAERQGPHDEKVPRDGRVPAGSLVHVQQHLPPVTLAEQVRAQVHCQLGRQQPRRRQQDAAAAWLQRHAHDLEGDVRLARALLDR